jgi:hypothetical protein
MKRDGHYAEAERIHEGVSWLDADTVPAPVSTHSRRHRDQASSPQSRFFERCPAPRPQVVPYLYIMARTKKQVTQHNSLRAKRQATQHN